MIPKTLIVCLTLFLLPTTHFGQPDPETRFRENGPLRGPVEKWMKHMEQNNPEEHQRLMELRENDPQGFHEALKSKVEKRRQMFKERHEGKRRDSEEIQKLDRKLKALIHTIRSESPENMDLHPGISEARELMAKIFDLKQRADRKEFEAMEQRLQRMKIIFETRAQNRDLIIDQQLERILRNPAPGQGKQNGRRDRPQPPERRP